MAAANSAARAEAPHERDERELVIVRIFDAPRALVWKVWSEPEHMVRWSGPRGFTFEVLKLGVKPGDSYRFRMRGPDGNDHWQQGVYREIVPMERIVCTFVWADQQGNPTGPETLLTVTFEDLGAKTRLTLRQTGFGSIPARDDHNQGWNSALDCLADYLVTLPREQRSV